MRTVRNVHERTLSASAETVGALLDRLAAADDPLFPSPAWAPLRLDRPLSVGADGGHGPVRYAVTAYEPGRSVRFDFAPPSDGHHRLDVEPLGTGRCRVRHVLVERQGPLDALSWALAVRPVHDTVVEELLDNAERAATGSVARPVRRGAYVRLLQRLTWDRPTAVAVPAAARLARAAFPRTDFTDAWRLPLRPGMDRDPRAWRDVLPFPVTAAGERELLLGKDAGHLDFRASLLVEDDHVTLSTVVRTHNLAGRLYWALVRHVHPSMARMALRRTHRRLALATAPAGERHPAKVITAGSERSQRGAPDGHGTREHGTPKHGPRGAGVADQGSPERGSHGDEPGDHGPRPDEAAVHGAPERGQRGQRGGGADEYGSPDHGPRDDEAAVHGTPDDHGPRRDEAPVHGTPADAPPAGQGTVGPEPGGRRDGLAARVPRA